ncbi:MAG: DUF2905 domain-containing protein [Nitrospirota bacterium]
MPQEFGRLLVIFGIILIALGGIFMAAGKLPPWLGRLPGDIVIERKNFSFYFPIVTSVLLSVLLTLIFWLFRR